MRAISWSGSRRIVRRASSSSLKKTSLHFICGFSTGDHRAPGRRTSVGCFQVGNRRHRRQYSIFVPWCERLGCSVELMGTRTDCRYICRQGASDQISLDEPSHRVHYCYVVHHKTRDNVFTSEYESCRVFVILGVKAEIRRWSGVRFWRFDLFTKLLHLDRKIARRLLVAAEMLIS